MLLSCRRCDAVANANATNSNSNSNTNANAYANAAQSVMMQDGRQWQSRWAAATRLQGKMAVAMGNDGAMGGRTAKWSLWAVGWWWCNGQYNGQRTIAADAVAAQWEANQDVRQRRSRCTVAVILRWTVAAAMGNGSAMGGGTAKRLQWAMGWRHHNGRHNGPRPIATKAEVVQWEVMRDGGQRQSQCTAVARSWWTMAAAMGNGGAMGGGMVKGSR
jgi:hypothetical protein